NRFAEVRRITELLEAGFDGLIDDLQHAASRQQLVFDQRNIRLDPCRVAIHQKSDCSGRSKNGDLSISKPGSAPELNSICPNLDRFLFQIAELNCLLDLVARLPV